MQRRHNYPRRKPAAAGRAEIVGLLVVSREEKVFAPFGKSPSFDFVSVGGGGFSNPTFDRCARDHGRAPLLRADGGTARGRDNSIFPMIDPHLDPPLVDHSTKSSDARALRSTIAAVSHRLRVTSLDCLAKDVRHVDHLGLLRSVPERRIHVGECHLRLADSMSACPVSMTAHLTVLHSISQV